MMGREIYAGRYTVDGHKDDQFVVFMIGMRINKWWAIHKWLPVFFAMPPMIKELIVNKELGCLSMENFLGLKTTLMIQYWRSEKDLFDYARNQTHLKAWNNFNKKVGNNDAVGIYHETYVITEGKYESFYGNMPKFGLSKVFGLKPVSHTTNSAHQRLKKEIS